jgi:hypothetical protein
MDHVEGDVAAYVPDEEADADEKHEQLREREDRMDFRPQALRASRHHRTRIAVSHVERLLRVE